MDFTRHGGQAEQSIQDLSRRGHVALDGGKKAGALGRDEGEASRLYLRRFALDV